MKKLLTILLLVGVLYGQSDTLTFKVKGLVCSFCAHGLTKGIGGLPFTDEKIINCITVSGSFVWTNRYFNI